MEKQKVEVDCSKSGMKTLIRCSIAFFVIASIAVLVTIIGFIIYLANNGEDAFNGILLAISSFLIAIGTFASGAICKGLSIIVETTLYKKTLLEEQYDFVEKEL